MSKTIPEILDELKNVDPTLGNCEKTKNLIRSLRKIALIEYKLHHPHPITRARPEGNKIMVKDYSYKPNESNTSFQRASTPNNTMFYGCIVPPESSITNSRILASLECSPLLRNGVIDSKGHHKVSFGRWTVMQDVKLVAVIQNENFRYNGNPYITELYDSFQKMMDETPENREGLIAITNFFAEEFGKKDIEAHLDYYLSALFTEVICESGYDGVMYPSVQANGELGMNVAIKPEAVNNKLKLDRVGECTLMKYKDQTIVFNDRNGKVNPDGWTLNMCDIPQNKRESLQQRLAELGCKSLKDLE